MSNELTQEGNNNLGFQGISNSSISVTQVIGKSAQYSELQERLKELEGWYLDASEEKRLDISIKINRQKDLIENFKREVLEFARLFERIDIDTERLKRIKALFEEGKIDEAKILIKTELPLMDNEQKRLLQERQRFETDIVPKLIHSSDEFLTLALATQYDYKNPKHFMEACEYFEKSIESYETENNLFLYGCCLEDYSFFDKAKFYFEKHLQKFSNEIDEYEKIEVLLSLGQAYTNLNDYKKAAKNFKEGIEIIREYLKEEKSLKLLTHLSHFLNGLGSLNTNFENYEDAKIELLEALNIQTEIANANDEGSLKYLARIINNLGLLHCNSGDKNAAEECYLKSFTIFKTLANTDQLGCLPDIALIHNNLANIYTTEKFKEAEEHFVAAIEIYDTLRNIGIHYYIPENILTLRNLSALYYKGIPNKEKSIDAAFTGILLGLHLHKSNSFVREEVEKCVAILNLWGISQEKIQQSIDETIATMQELQTELEKSSSI